MKVTPVEGYYSYVKRDESKKKRKKISDKKTKENDESIKKSAERDTERHFDCYQ